MQDKNVNPKFLITFCRIANCKSYSEASRILNISSTAISKEIINLELQLSKTLFYRNNKGIQLTEEGQNLYNYIHPLFEKIWFGVNADCNNDIKIGSYSHIFSSYLTEKIKNVKNNNSDLKISFISTMRRNELVEMLTQNEVNFIIDNNENEIINKKITKKKIENLDNIFISNKPLKINNIKDLENFKYILDTKSSTDKRLIKLLKIYGVSIEANIDANATETKISFAKKGLGISHVIKVAVEKELENQELYEVDIPIELPKSPVVLLYLNNSLRKIDRDFIKEYLSI